MPRMSIYLPDELAQQLNHAAKGESSSQVIQAALRRYLGESDGGPYVRPPADADQLLERARAKLLPAAQDEYERGYTAALNRAPDLPWDILDELADRKFDIATWIRPWVDGVHNAILGKAPAGTPAPDWLSCLAEDLGELADPIGMDRFSFRRSRMYMRGYSDALKAAFDSVLGH